MTDRQYAIFSFIRSEETVDWVKILNTFKDGSSYQEIETILKFGLKTGYIERTSVLDSPPLCKLKLTDEGAFALMAEDELRISQRLSREENIQKEQTAEKERNRILEAEATRRKEENRSDRRFQLLLAVFQAFLSFVAGLLVEHFTGIVEWIAAFF